MHRRDGRGGAARARPCLREAPCLPAGTVARRNLSPHPDATSSSRIAVPSSTCRFSASSVAAASLLPPPSPAAQGMRFSRWMRAPVLRAAPSRSSLAARGTRLSCSESLLAAGEERCRLRARMSGYRTGLWSGRCCRCRDSPRGGRRPPARGSPWQGRAPSAWLPPLRGQGAVDVPQTHPLLRRPAFQACARARCHRGTAVRPRSHAWHAGRGRRNCGAASAVSGSRRRRSRGSPLPRWLSMGGDSRTSSRRTMESTFGGGWNERADTRLTVLARANA